VLVAAVVVVPVSAAVVERWQQHLVAVVAAAVVAVLTLAAVREQLLIHRRRHDAGHPLFNVATPSMEVRRSLVPRPLPTSCAYPVVQTAPLALVEAAASLETQRQRDVVTRCVEGEAGKGVTLRCVACAVSAHLLTLNIVHPTAMTVNEACTLLLLVLVVDGGGTGP
jgi:hypothetical protein